MSRLEIRCAGSPRFPEASGLAEVLRPEGLVNCGDLLFMCVPMTVRRIFEGTQIVRAAVEPLRPLRVLLST